MQVADLVVVGLGAMGSAVSFQAARRGLDVVGLDRFAPPHDQGSSHGETRITRQAIGEGLAYVPLAIRAHEIWREIEAETGEDLLLTCGALILSAENNSALHHGRPHFLESTIAAARRFGIPHELLDATEVTARFPQLTLRSGERGYFEPGGGLVYPERCVAAQIALARRAGARIGVGETVRLIEPTAAGARVVTDRDIYEAAHVVVAAGAWTPGLLGQPLAGLEIHRQILFWFATEGDDYGSDRFPVYIWMHGQTEDDLFYGFPTVPGGAGIKVATETYRQPLARPEAVDRGVTPADATAMHASHIAGRLRGVSTRCLRSETCFYTTTPDGDFVIDHHPESERIHIVSACSGHGFKHSAAIGEAVAERVAGLAPRVDLSGFRLGRFAGRASAAGPALD